MSHSAMTDSIPALSLAVHRAGGVDKFSRKHNISEGHIRAVMEGRAKPGPRTLKAIGVK